MTSENVLSMQDGTKWWSDYAVASVLLRTVPKLLAHAWVTATYRACLWSISTCTVTPSHSGHIQATAARPHGCNSQARFCLVASSNIVPEEVVLQFVEWKANLRGDTRWSVAAIVCRSLRFLAMCEKSCHQNCWNGVFFCKWLLTARLFMKSPRQKSRASS